MRSRFARFVGVVLLLAAAASQGIEKLEGLVTDEAGRPIETPTVEVCGLERKLPDGSWDRNRHPHCLLPRAVIEAGGRFTVAIDEKDVRANLWVGKEGYAPTFVGGVGAQARALKVVLQRGLQVSGHVTSIVGGKLQPVLRAAVHLGCASGDLSHQKQVFDDPYFFVMKAKTGDDLPHLQHAFTGAFGEYVFRVSPPPENKTWFIVCMDKMVPLEVRAGQPVKGPDFEVEVRVR